ncbi:uncharacterized protein K452DRAFT_236069 [Aplosporella prunicola CBS 121167]|uniref:aminodeoxychorismate synthase n=1 Tax=Aplosporella prunicola CBS 121167 TaxID=1176127 RepID=A0A6A6B0A5_9PEZI|nr:uncharacterized protein K452DRAFT_236069 [Aplosporella prunicola CBS 121167]KAF2137306.1 hypothetical protein K452DRAFT_236069 [Aplosporella prunicola CBS 121167]
MEPGPRILFIDAYDSFAHNIVALLQDKLDATVTTIHIDDARYLQAANPIEAADRAPTPAFLALLSTFDAAIAGPGPGNPLDASSVGLIAALWQLPDAALLPVLGICLGMQSLGAAFGGQVTRLREPRHGVVTYLSHTRQGVFRGVGEVSAVLYHSLRVEFPPEEVEGEGEEVLGLWGRRGDLLPLAYDTAVPANGPVLQAVAHAAKPFTGLQYHPESICTSPAGAQVVRNWWAGAKAWLEARGRAPGAVATQTQTQIQTQTLPQQQQRQRASSYGEDMPARIAHVRVPGTHNTAAISALLNVGGSESAEAVILESGTDASTGRPVRAETGNKSIVAVFEPERPPLRVVYFTEGRVLELWAGRGRVWRGEGVDVVKERDENGVNDVAVGSGPAESPFWGGLVGWVGYEAGLQTIEVQPSKAGAAAAAAGPDAQRRPDMAWVFVSRSVVVDHVGGGAYVQSWEETEAREKAWVARTAARLSELAKKEGAGAQEKEKEKEKEEQEQEQELDARLRAAVRHTPAQAGYEDAVRHCQESIRAGDSYELCLTAQTRVLVPRSTASAAATSHTLYSRLRTLNPAPFSAYLRLSGAHIISSSPERFLRWTRRGTCQYRPIKGTVKKSADMTREKAEALLKAPKEQAENLMIVDLVRHDLHGVVGAGNVRVTKLMGVEEYETVWQLVSVVEGDLGGAKAGISILAASLPPGSMTGAPKKRSCELLTAIEDSVPRGVYSGVLGYLDVGGGGDFSVVIRSGGVNGGGSGSVNAVSDSDYDVWTVGAGGAVTAQSDPRAEYEEMVTKLESTLRVFEAR